MGIVAEDIERVRATVRLSDVVAPYVDGLKRVGTRQVARCPFHAENTGSFNINDEKGFYKCFGCGVGGDAITFVREIEHVDFVGAVEILAVKAGITLRYDDNAGQSAERQRRKQLLDTLERATEWYHQRLLTGPDAGPARGYLRSRGIDGETARRFRIGWAPDDWDALSTSLRGVAKDVLADTGLAFVNKRGRLQDSFRARVLFPISDENGAPLAFGGRILPGAASEREPKYKNSPETRLYAKSKTLYALNMAKADIVREGEVVICEGYTDVIGFFQAGVPRAVATCGTALTEDHVRLLQRYARRLVLAFDADNAGQNAAERVYAWEKTHDVEVRVAHFPRGMDPADLARTDPAALAKAVAEARPFLGFRIDRVLAGAHADTPERRARAAETALAMIAEHPNEIVRRDYAGQVAMQLGLPPGELVAMAARRVAAPRVRTVEPVARRTDTGEVNVLRLLIHRWDEVAPFLTETLFAEDDTVGAFRALAASGGDVRAAIEAAAPGAAELLLGLAAQDGESTDPEGDVVVLIRSAVRRRIAELPRDPALGIGAAKAWAEALDDRDQRRDAAARLLGWLDGLADVRGAEGSR